jgi:hypothetical protein
MISHCSIELLEATLADELSSEDEATLDRHLHECPVCNSTIEELVSGVKWTDELDEMLAEIEIAERLAISTSNVRIVTSRVLAKLRAAISEFEGDE